MRAHQPERLKVRSSGFPGLRSFIAKGGSRPGHPPTAPLSNVKSPPPKRFPCLGKVDSWHKYVSPFSNPGRSTHRKSARHQPNHSKCPENNGVSTHLPVPAVCDERPRPGDKSVTKKTFHAPKRSFSPRIQSSQLIPVKHFTHNPKKL